MDYSSNVLAHSTRNLRLLLLRGHNQRRSHICLDNLRHCILHGLLRPHSCHLLQPHHHCRSSPWLQPLMQYQLHTLCLRRLHLWFRTPPLCTPLHQLSLPHSTNRSNYMAYCSSSISCIDYTTYTFTELTVPTSYPSFSTTGRYIYSSSS